MGKLDGIDVAIERAGGKSLVTGAVTVAFESHLFTADEFQGKSSFNIQVLFTSDQVKAFNKKYSKELDKAYASQMEEYNKLDEDEREEKDPPKNIGIRFKLHRGAPSKDSEGNKIDGKKGDIVKGLKSLKFSSKFGIPLFDVHGNPLSQESLGKDELWAGDTVKVQFKGKVTFMSSRNEVAAVLYPTAVQLLKKGGTNSSGGSEREAENCFSDESDSYQSTIDDTDTVVADEDADYDDI